jgi:hypothetical protein
MTNFPQAIANITHQKLNLGTVEQEKQKIDSYYDRKFGAVESITVNQALLAQVEEAQEYLITADLGPRARELMLFLYTAVNTLIQDVISQQEINNQLNTKVRDLTLEFVKVDLGRGSFRG